MRVLLKNNYATFNAEIIKGSYSNGALALSGINDEGDSIKLSTNLKESKGLPSNQCYIKNWSENAGFLECLEQASIVRRLGVVTPTGYVEAPLVEVL